MLNDFYSFLESDDIENTELDLTDDSDMADEGYNCDTNSDDSDDVSEAFDFFTEGDEIDVDDMDDTDTDPEDDSDEDFTDDSDEDLEGCGKKKMTESVRPLAFKPENARLFSTGNGEYLITESDLECVFNYYNQNIDGYETVRKIAEAHNISPNQIRVYLSEGVVSNPNVHLKKAKGEF